MLVELCVILRMVMNEEHQLTLDRYQIVPCEDFAWTKSSKESYRDNILNEIETEKPMQDDILEINPRLNYMWAHNPMAQMLLPQPKSTFWNRPAARNPAVSLTKLSKSLQNDFNPSFRKSDFEFEKRNKPVTLLAFRNAKNGPAQQKALYKTSREPRSGEVAEMQSPYNDISVFWQDERIS